MAALPSNQAQLDVRDDVRSTVAITKAQASASNHRIQLLSAWLSDLPVASSGGDQGSMKPGGRTSSRTGDPGAGSCSVCRCIWRRVMCFVDARPDLVLVCCLGHIAARPDGRSVTRTLIPRPVAGGLLQSTVSIVTRKPCLAVSLVAKMDILSCLFSDDCMNVDGVPLLDLSLRDTEIELHGTVGGSDDSMSGILSTTLAGDVYSAEKKAPTRHMCLQQPHASS